MTKNQTGGKKRGILIGSEIGKKGKRIPSRIMDTGVENGVGS